MNILNIILITNNIANIIIIKYLGNNYENYAEYKVESKIGNINIF